MRSAAKDWPSSSFATMPCLVLSTPANLTPVEKLIPLFLKALSIAFETASSSAGTNLGNPSIMVTSEPSDFQTLANSTPITPPPRITTLEGTEVSFKACSEVIT